MSKRRFKFSAFGPRSLAAKLIARLWAPFIAAALFMTLAGFLVLQQTGAIQIHDNWQVLALAALMSGVGLAIMAIFAGLTARTLASPLVELTRQVSKTLGGNLEVTLPVKGDDEIDRLAETINTLLSEVRSAVESLKANIAERNAQLATVNEIAATVATSLDIKEVMSKTVNLIRDRLGYYHVSIFLLDEKGENAIVRESTGEVGRIFKERPHTLAVGSQSIIGYVTAARQPRIASDTETDSVHFKNPLLPNTRSEMGLPLMIGETLFGALDVQSTQPHAFSDDDVAVLQNMANQIAVAINNARLFQEAQTRLAEISLLNRQYLARAWETYSQANPQAVQLEFDGGVVQPAADGQSVALTLRGPQLSADGATIAIPIVLRDEVIGEFSLSNPVGAARWGPEDLALVEAVVAQVALAVENARLLEETQAALAEANRLARRERVISEITNKITYGADVKRILQIAAEELRLATGSTRALVRLTGQAQPREKL